MNLERIIIDIYKMAKRKIPTQLFKKLCTRCPKIYRPSGKYNKLCPVCMTKAMSARKEKVALSLKNRKRRIDSPNRKV